MSIPDVRITFLVFAHNEEKRLSHMLQCLNGNGEIIVIDNCSSDRTVEVAKQFTSAVFQHRNVGYVENEKTMAFALGKVETEYVYLAYVDEFIPLALMTELKRIAMEGRFQIVELHRKNYMYGREVFNYGKHHLRMFKKGAVDFRGNIVHKLGKYLVPSKMVVRLPKGDETSLWHLSPYNTDRLELAHNRYANLEALQRHSLVGQSFSPSLALFKLVFYFFGTYFGLGGFRGGWPGLFISLQIAYFKFSIEARLWEMDHGITLDSIEGEYDRIKTRLLSAYERKG